MTVQYKNWKSEIAWLRRMAKNCEDLAFAYRGIAASDLCDSIDRLGKSLDYRATSLEKAKGTAQTS